MKKGTGGPLNWDSIGVLSGLIWVLSPLSPGSIGVPSGFQLGPDGVSGRFQRGGAHPVHVDLRGRFHAGQHVVDGLAAKTDEFGSDDFGDKIGRNFEDSLCGAAVQTLAQDGGHGAGQGLDLGAQGDFEMNAPIPWRTQENSHRIRALRILPDIFQIEGFARLGGMERSGLCHVDQHFPALRFRERSEEIDQFLKSGRVQGEKNEG